MHHPDFNKMQREKARWELHKIAVCCLEQVLEVTAHKITAVWPPATHLKNHSNKMNKTCRALLEKQGQNILSDVLL